MHYDHQRYDRCQTVLKEGHRRTLKQWKAEQLTLSELEFEWIRQVRGGGIGAEGGMTLMYCSCNSLVLHSSLWCTSEQHLTVCRNQSEKLTNETLCCLTGCTVRNDNEIIMVRRINAAAEVMENKINTNTNINTTKQQ